MAKAKPKKKKTTKKSVSKVKMKAKASSKTKKATKKTTSKKAPQKPTKATAKKTAAKKTKPTVQKAAPKTPPKTSPKTTKFVKSGDVSKLFTPLDDRVLVLREGVSQMTAGGIYIPDTVADSERPNRGRVLAVGRGHRDKKGRLHPLDVKTGDEVMFNTYAGSEVSIDGTDYLILREDDIIAITKS